MPYDSMPAIGALSQVKWNALKATNYVVCYCAAGTNRSPIGVVNVAYFAYLANEAFPPKIVLLEGGFGGYQQIKGAPSEYRKLSYHDRTLIKFNSHINVEEYVVMILQWC